METLGRLKTIVASLENGLELGDVPETLQWCIETIERLQKERDDLSKRNERMKRPRCYHYTDETLPSPCPFCGAKVESDVCRDMTDTADLDRIKQERDAALAEVERLNGLPSGDGHKFIFTKTGKVLRG